ncbi:HDOD domain-containing protein [Stenotrophomonas rhizophila]|uniref:HDOD domain-containing protein n=1 Tax=Stenotrophomonas rhizophila TaxID=216778 RepID=UPI00211AEBA6|nr:HDOD domain-containing protein [Stenotrophomonas rhizophila]
MMAILAGAGVLLVALLGWGWYRRPAEAGPAPGSTGGRARTQPQPPTPTQPCTGDADEVLQVGLHALALQPGGGSAPATVAQDAALLAAVAAALEAQDWSARHLPRRPQLLPQLIQTVNDSDASARSMASIISQDAVLTGNLLRIANSPVYRLQAKPVDSLQRAVTLVGTEGIRQIISAVLVQPVMQLHSDAFPQFGTVVWEHALLASRAAADHARLVTHEDGFAAQWMGLTQGLGAALVMRHLLDVAREQAVLPSPQLASTLLDAWTLPVASRIAAAWELPLSVHQALLRDADATGGGLAASLHFARAGASASLLCRHGRISQAQALALLEQLHDTPAHALQWIWRRLHGRAVETLEADESADA